MKSRRTCTEIESDPIGDPSLPIDTSEACRIASYSQLPGGIVVYSILNLDEWVDSRVRLSTSERSR